LTKSSNIQNIKFDPKTKTLEITFSGGRVYQYSGVSEEVHKSFVGAKSLGEHFHKHIKDVYAYKKI
jgi:hypothetical protein